MTFKPKDLSPLAYQQDFTLHRYAAGSDDIEAEGYFDRAASLKEGDVIPVSFNPRKTRFYTVTAAEKGQITVKMMGKEHLRAPRDPALKGKSEKPEEGKDETQQP